MSGRGFAADVRFGLPAISDFVKRISISSPRVTPEKTNRGKKSAPAFGKRDIVFLSALFIFGLALTFCIYYFSENGSEIRITVDGQLYGVYDLREDQEIDVTLDEGKNVIVIENGEVRMKMADCPDGLCMHQGAVSRDKQTIVCLPHKLVVEVVGGKVQEYDAISR